MPDVWVTDLTHFLDEQGLIAPRQGRARRLAEHLTSIVAMTSAEPETPDDGSPGSIRCRRRPRRKPCPGFVDADYGPSLEIVWWCKHCGDRGVITEWSGSFWDIGGCWRRGKSAWNRALSK